MKFFLASVIALGLAASSAFAQLTVNTPASVVECEPVEFTWSGGVGPYFLSLLPGADPTGVPLATLGEFAGDSATWLVNLGVGVAIIVTLRDSTGLVVQSAPVNIQPSSVSCNTSTLSVSPSTGVASATGSSGSTPTGSSNNSPATLTTPSTPNTGTGTGISTSGSAQKTGASASSTSSTSTKSAGASRVNGQFAAAGIIGAAMVALLG